jgi:hypothetical protein
MRLSPKVLFVGVPKSQKRFMKTEGNFRDVPEVTVP